MDVRDDISAAEALERAAALIEDIVDGCCPENHEQAAGEEAKSFLKDGLDYHRSAGETGLSIASRV